MTALDILVLLLVGYFGVKGLSRGFVNEALSLVAWVAAIAAVKLFHTPLAEALVGPVGTSSGSSVLAFALIFGITFMIGRLIANRIGAATKSSGLGAFDRVLGFGFGAIKGLLGASLIFLFASLLYDTVYGGKSERPGWMVESRTYPLLNATSRALVTFVDQRRNGGGGPTPPTG
jgi:membrane protein required for colicin V production